jgi:hypothetical protein
MRRRNMDWDEAEAFHASGAKPRPGRSGETGDYRKRPEYLEEPGRSKRRESKLRGRRVRRERGYE